MKAASSISAYLHQVYEDWQRTGEVFAANIWPEEHWPIPFFGNPTKAKVLTVGVNPSSQEFCACRGWNTVTSRRHWKEMLRDYFNCDFPPHEWFNAWARGLPVMGVNYTTGKAAHVDVSYRPTLAMSHKRTDRKLFRTMVERDVAWLFRLLPLCLSPMLRGVLATTAPPRTDSLS